MIVTIRVTHYRGLYRMMPLAVDAQSGIGCRTSDFLIAVIVSAVRQIDPVMPLLKHRAVHVRRSFG